MTAVEFLLKELANNFEEEMQNIYSKNMHLVANICEQAKEMEKEQQGYSKEEVLKLLLNCPTNTEKDTIEWFKKFKKQ
jgi:hypothetical protein